jgi:hypothetical protein
MNLLNSRAASGRQDVQYFDSKNNHSRPGAPNLTEQPRVASVFVRATELCCVGRLAVWWSWALVWLTLGCAYVPRVATAGGEVAGYRLRGPVDSIAARNYLEGRPLPPSLDAERREHWVKGTVPSRDELNEVARAYSPDVATLLFVETMSAQPRVRELRARYEVELREVRRLGVIEGRPHPPEDMLVLLVPGWFYKTHGEITNADFRIQRRLYDEWKIPYRLVPVLENGTVEENARIVAEAIRAASAEHRLYVVSASKSGPEVAVALGRELKPEETRKIVGWLSVVGAVRGSPLAERVLAPDFCWFVNYQLAQENFDMRGLHSMQAKRSRPLFDTLQLPPNLRIVSLVAVPLSGNITDRVKFGYSRLRAHGPNDGLTLLADELIPGAVPLLLPGSDHLLGAEDQRLWSTAIFRVLMAELAEAQHPQDATIEQAQP